MSLAEDGNNLVHDPREGSYDGSELEVFEPFSGSKFGVSEANLLGQCLTYRAQRVMSSYDFVELYLRKLGTEPHAITGEVPKLCRVYQQAV